MQRHAHDGEGINEYPQPRAAGIEQCRWNAVIPDQTSERMYADSETEHTGGKITGTDEPALGPAAICADGDAASAEPLHIQEESERLLDICEHEVEDEEHELRGPGARFHVPSVHAVE